jgi:membrane-bound serine protease (ClpP class)
MRSGLKSFKIGFLWVILYLPNPNMKFLFLALLLLTSPGLAKEPTMPGSRPSVSQHQNVVIIPIRDQIAPPELFILRRGLKTAIEKGAETVIIDMETPGGRLDTTFEILEALDKFPGKVITYINHEAISAGALISAGTDEIWFSPTGVIGAAAPVTGGGEDIDETLKQKIVSYLKAKVRSLSRDDENRAKAISAMIDENYELKFGNEIIKPKGELLTLTADEAIKPYGKPARPLLASGISPDLHSLTDTLFGKGNYTTIRLEVTWSERLAQYITAIAPVLLAIGLLLIFIEFKTPGFGMFGIGGGIILAIVFFGHYAAGLSGHEAALLFFLGFILVMIDLFFLPGFFILAIPGGLLMVSSLIWGMSDIWPDQPVSIGSDLLYKPITNLTFGILGAIGLFAILLRFMPKGGLWGGMVLESAVRGETTPSSIAREDSSLIGATGHAVTALFPSGEIEIHGKRYDARLNIGTLPVGAPVKVVSVGEFELRVEEMKHADQPVT